MKLKHIAPLLLACCLPALSGCIAGLTYNPGAPLSGHLYIECDACATVNNTAAPGSGFNPQSPNNNGSEIVAFSRDASGTPTATSTIVALPANNNFAGIKVDAAGNLYTTSYNNSTNTYSILVYAPVSSGTATPNPARIITSTIPMQDLDSFAVAPDGTIYFSDDDNGLLRFPAGSNGSTTPNEFGALYYVSMAVDVNGNLYGAEYGDGAYVDVFHPGFSSDTPVRTFNTADTSFYANFLAVDTAGAVYLNGYSENASAPEIVVFSANSSGTTTPSRTISGSNTDFYEYNSIAVDGQGNLYVRSTTSEIAAVSAPGAHAAHAHPLSSEPPAEILEFSPTANGNVAPTNTFTTNLVSYSSYDIALY